MAQVHEALAAVTRSAVHLEMRDGYTPDEPGYRDWRAGERFDPVKRWPAWFELASTTVARGIEMRRARIVSEPVSEYIRFEYELTGPYNVASGERVRWLPRRRASDLALPGNDFWLFDDDLVIFNHFAGDGTWAGEERSTDPAVVRLCSSAFEAVWVRGIDHEQYQPA